MCMMFMPPIRSARHIHHPLSTSNMKKNIQILILFLTPIIISGQSKMNKEYQSDWAFYFSNVDDKLSSIATDLGLANIAPIHSQPFIIYISIQMNKPRVDGLSSKEEANKLWEIEDEINQNLKREKLEFTSVGRLTSDGYRDLYFFGSNKLIIEKSLSESMVKYSDYKFDIGSKEDKEWKSYFEFLYPLPKQLQSIQNFRVVENIQNSGDDLSQEREVFHWINFQNLKKLEEFEKYTISKGFRTLNKGKSENIYVIQISRIDKVGFNDIDEYTLNLWEKAKEYEGNYNGWETSIEK